MFGGQSGNRKKHGGGHLGDAGVPGLEKHACFSRCPADLEISLCSYDSQALPSLMASFNKVCNLLDNCTRKIENRQKWRSEECLFLMFWVMFSENLEYSVSTLWNKLGSVRFQDCCRISPLILYTVRFQDCCRNSSLILYEIRFQDCCKISPLILSTAPVSHLMLLVSSPRGVFLV